MTVGKRLSQLDALAAITPDDIFHGVNNPSGVNVDYAVTAAVMRYFMTNVYNVMDNGAKGDGATNDTASIQAAIDAAHTAYLTIGCMQTVFLPPGCYLIYTNALVTYSGYTMALVLKQGVKIRGAGIDSTILKVANNQPSYKTLFGHDPSQALDGFEISDLTIDANFPNNTHDGTDILTQYRMHLAVFKGSRIRVHHNRFTNFDNLNCVAINGTAVNDVRITENIFDNYGFPMAWHDASTVYLNANGFVVSENSFSANSGNPGAGCAIETHGDQQIITENIIKNVMVGSNITGVSSSNDNLVVSDNVIQNVRWGIALYSQTSSGSTRGLRNVQLTGNMIVQDLDAWYGAGATPNTLYGSGIILAGSWDLPVENLLIANNEIYLKPFTSLTQAGDSVGSGIQLYDPLPHSAQHIGIKIVNNVIDGALSAGIWILMDVVDLEIAGNTIRNTGQAANVNAGYKLGMYIGGTSIRAGRIHHNLIIDTQSVKTIAFGFGLYTTTVVDSLFSDNQVHCVNGTIGELVGTTDLNAAWLLDTAFRTWSTPTGYFKAGSKVLAKDTGITHVQSSLTSTMSWS